jgi:hypothetical protein
MKKACVCCGAPSSLSRGELSLCEEHHKRNVWDPEGGYLRQVKCGGKWEGIWPSQAGVAKLLEQVGFCVDQEVRPLWAKSPTGVLLPYDMAVSELKLLIEYQGKQHYQWEKYFFKNKERWNAYVRRQALKKLLARSAGWFLVEVSYKEQPLSQEKLLGIIEKQTGLKLL